MYPNVYLNHWLPDGTINKHFKKQTSMWPSLLAVWAGVPPPTFAAFRSAPSWPNTRTTSCTKKIRQKPNLLDCSQNL